MSVRVNLLPREFEEQSRQRRIATFGVIGVVIFAGLLGLLFIQKQSSVDDAVARRDQAQAMVSQLQAEVQSLQGFQELANELVAGNEVLIAAMGPEIAVARVLNDVALSLPTTSSLTSVTLDRRRAEETTAGQVDLGGPIANLLMAGYSVERYAPGVEGVLLRFDQVRGLDLTYLNAAAESDIGTVAVTSFDANGLLNEEVLTQRYADGLPEGRG